MTSEKEFELAEKRGQETYDNVPHAIEATYVPSIRRLLILLSNGLEISLRQEEFATFRNASPADLETIELNAEGFEVHFPKIDEGFWIPDLLEHLLGVRKFLRKAADEEMAEYRERQVA
jgi:hypothetical protein